MPLLYQVLSLEELRQQCKKRNIKFRSKHTARKLRQLLQQDDLPKLQKKPVVTLPPPLGFGTHLGPNGALDAPASLSPVWNNHGLPPSEMDAQNPQICEMDAQNKYPPEIGKQTSVNPILDFGNPISGFGNPISGFGAAIAKEKRFDIPISGFGADIAKEKRFGNPISGFGEEIANFHFGDEKENPPMNPNLSLPPLWPHLNGTTIPWQDMAIKSCETINFTPVSNQVPSAETQTTKIFTVPTYSPDLGLASSGQLWAKINQGNNPSPDPNQTEKSAEKDQGNNPSREPTPDISVKVNQFIKNAKSRGPKTIIIGDYSSEDEIILPKSNPGIMSHLNIKLTGNKQSKSPNKKVDLDVATVFTSKNNKSKKRAQSNQEYEVEAIIDKVCVGRKEIYYRVYWKGFGMKDCTWEESVSSGIGSKSGKVQEYVQNLKKCQGLLKKQSAGRKKMTIEDKQYLQGIVAVRSTDNDRKFFRYLWNVLHGTSEAEIMEWQDGNMVIWNPNKFLDIIKSEICSPHGDSFDQFMDFMRKMGFQIKDFKISDDNEECGNATEGWQFRHPLFTDDNHENHDQIGINSIPMSEYMEPPVIEYQPDNKRRRIDPDTRVEEISSNDSENDIIMVDCNPSRLVSDMPPIHLISKMKQMNGGIGKSDAVVLGKKNDGMGKSDAVVSGKKNDGMGKSDAVVLGKKKQINSGIGKSDAVVLGKKKQMNSGIGKSDAVVSGKKKQINDGMGKSDALISGNSDALVWGNSDALVSGNSDALLSGKKKQMNCGMGTSDALVSGNSDALVSGNCGAQNQSETMSNQVGLYYKSNEHKHTLESHQQLKDTNDRNDIQSDSSTLTDVTGAEVQKFAESQRDMNQRHREFLNDSLVLCGMDADTGEKDKGISEPSLLAQIAHEEGEIVEKETNPRDKPECKIIRDFDVSEDEANVSNPLDMVTQQFVADMGTQDDASKKGMNVIPVRKGKRLSRKLDMGRSKSLIARWEESDSGRSAIQPLPPKKNLGLWKSHKRCKTLIKHGYHHSGHHHHDSGHHHHDSSHHHRLNQSEGEQRFSRKKKKKHNLRKEDLLPTLTNTAYDPYGLGFSKKTKKRKSPKPNNKRKEPTVDIPSQSDVLQCWGSIARSSRDYWGRFQIEDVPVTKLARNGINLPLGEYGYLQNKKTGQFEMTRGTSLKKCQEKIMPLVTCPGCNDIYYSIITMPCGHQLCGDCVRRDLRDKSVSTCRLCKKAFGPQFFAVLNKNRYASVLQNVLMDVLFPNLIINHQLSSQQQENIQRRYNLHAWKKLVECIHRLIEQSSQFSPVIVLDDDHIISDQNDRNYTPSPTLSQQGIAKANSEDVKKTAEKMAEMGWISKYLPQE